MNLELEHGLVSEWHIGQSDVSRRSSWQLRRQIYFDLRREAVLDILIQTAVPTVTTLRTSGRSFGTAWNVFPEKVIPVFVKIVRRRRDGWCRVERRSGRAVRRRTRNESVAMRGEKRMGVFKSCDIERVILGSFEAWKRMNSWWN